MNSHCGQCTAYRPGPVSGYGICCAEPPKPMFLGFRKSDEGIQTPVTDSFYPPVRETSLQCRDGFQQRELTEAEIGPAEGSA